MNAPLTTKDLELCAIKGTKIMKGEKTEKIDKDWLKKSRLSHLTLLKELRWEKGHWFNYEWIDKKILFPAIVIDFPTNTGGGYLYEEFNFTSQEADRHTQV
ncbi:hypothetical protein Pcinc_019169 [Petrolisthes cinctipes]|uniref:Uncharacterized protein n=1 Tax=Petrolisthes cinctipes TaxID=88211 RepID=A0AAE1FKV0_PETCI|nr:hypothetical protein Pcinc_019169 [Petrolisthes cinctipes]